MIDWYSKKNKNWETKHSTLKQINGTATYEECRLFACSDISRRTFIEIDNTIPIYEIPKGRDFHFIGRVNTSRFGYDAKSYYHDFEKRKYISFSTINNKNVSTFFDISLASRDTPNEIKKVFFIYNIMPKDIVHIFPMDSDTKRFAEDENTLTKLPSLWITLEELEKLTIMFKVYNQITCTTKRDGKIIKPVAIGAFDEINDAVINIATEFKLPIILCHPDKNANRYNNDVLLNNEELYNQNLETLLELLEGNKDSLRASIANANKESNEDFKTL